MNWKPGHGNHSKTGNGKNNELLLPVLSSAKAHIQSLASWAMVIVVVTVFGYVLNVLELVMGSNEPVVTQTEGFTASFLSGGKSVGGTVVTIMIGLVINYFLYRFASTAVSSINGLSQESLAIAFVTSRSILPLQLLL